jgi:hypothetical protein
MDVLHTQQELDDLPVGSVVMTLWDDGPLHAVMQKYSDGWYGFPSDSALHPLGSGRPPESVAVLWRSIDHKTCGHVNHTTLDGSRHEEMHSAIFGLITKWSAAGNRAGTTDVGRRVYREVVADLVDAMHPFEIEQ